MMRLKWNIKKTLTGVLAIILTLGCVLTFIPSEVLASWSVPDATSKSQGVNNAQGNYKVNFNFFGQNLYMPAYGEMTYTYYTLDDYTNSGTPFYTSTVPLTADEVAAIAALNNSSTKELALGTLSGSSFESASDVYRCNTNDTDGGFFNSNRNKHYDCDLYHIELTGSTSGSVFSLPSTTLSTLNGYSFNIGSALGTLTAGISVTDNYDNGISGSVTSTSSTFSAKAFESTPNASNVKLGIVPVSVSASFNGATSTQLSDKLSHTAKNGSGTQSNDAYRYSYTPSVNVTLSYKAYVIVLETHGGYERTERLAQIGTGVLYTVGGYASGDTAYAPEAADLINALPSDPDSELTSAEQQGNVKSRAKYICGFYTSMPTLTDGNITYGSAYTFPSTITSDVTVWVEVATENPLLASTKTDLNGSLKGASSGTFSPYISASTNNLSTDICYIAKENKFYLSADIKSGVTLNFMLNAGVYDYNAETTLTAGALETPDSTEGANVVSNATANVSDNTRDYTVALQNDITIDGIVRIGGKTGTRSNQTTEGQGIIIGNYVALDLNGHTLTINGMLHSFGYIYDSVGTGKIIVNTNGAIVTQMVAYGLFGGDHTLQTYNMGVCPFEEYNLPYIQTKVEIITSGSSSGALYGSSCINLGGLGLSNFVIKLFGNAIKPAKGINTDLGDAMFNLSGNGKIVIDTEIISELSANAKLQSLCYDVKNTVALEDLTVDFNGVAIGVELSVKGIDAAAPLDFKRMYFPVSPMFDLTFKNSSLDLDQYMVVMPGATVTFDESSFINLSYKTVTLEKVTVSISDEIISKHSDYKLSGGIIALSHNMSTSNVAAAERPISGKFGLVSSRPDGKVSDDASFNRYWSLFDEAVVNIYGHVSFDSGNTRPYMLAGNVNVSSFKDASGAVKEWNLANLNSTALANINLVTHGTYIMPATCETGIPSSASGILELFNLKPTARVSYYCTEVMKSNGRSYLIDTANGIYEEGTYSFTDGIFRATDDTKYIITRQDEINKKGIIDNTTTPVLIDSDLGNEIVASGGQYYVYFGGTYNKITDSTGVTGETTMLAATATNLNKFQASNDSANNGYSKILRWNTAGYWYQSAS